MSSSQLIEIADKVFRNRDKKIEKKHEKRYKDEQRRTDERFVMLAAALGKSFKDFSTTKAKKPPLALRLPVAQISRKGIESQSLSTMFKDL